MATAVPEKVFEYAWKFARILGLSTIPRFAIRDRITSRWIGLYTGGPEPLIQLQKRATHDEDTLARLVAHEMCHYADDMALRKRGSSAFFRGYGGEHGDEWQAFASKINRIMGTDYVTVFGDQVLVATRPFTIMIDKLEDGRFFFKMAINVTDWEAEYMVKMARHGARFLETTDPRWAHGKRFSSRKVSVPDSPEGQKKLRDLYRSAKK